MLSSNTVTLRLCLSGCVFLAALASSAQVSSSPAELEPLDLTPILGHLEETQDPAQFRQYAVTREYKVFHGDDKQPISEVTAQIEFIPPDTWTYKVTQTRGNRSAEKMVRELLNREAEAAKKDAARTTLRGQIMTSFFSARKLRHRS